MTLTGRDVHWWGVEYQILTVGFLILDRGIYIFHTQIFVNEKKERGITLSCTLEKNCGIDPNWKGCSL